jgi:GntR family transcriptional regulator
MVTAGKSVSEKLGISAAEKVIYIRRLISIGNEPGFYHREYLIYDPRTPIVEAEMEITTLAGLFEGKGSEIIKSGKFTIEATLLDEEEARILQTPLPSAALSLTHIFFDYHDRPISWGWFICNRDQLSFTAKVGFDKTE